MLEGELNCSKMNMDGCAYRAEGWICAIFVIRNDFIIVIVLLLPKPDGNICDPIDGCWSGDMDASFLLCEELKFLIDESVGLGSLPIGMVDGLELL